MERETNKIKTPQEGHEIELLTFITGREQREINNALYDNANVEVVDGQPVFNNLKTKDIVNALQDKRVETLIVSINGKKENLLDTVLNMKAQDYDFVIQALNEITSGKKKE